MRFRLRGSTSLLFDELDVEIVEPAPQPASEPEPDDSLHEAAQEMAALGARMGWEPEGLRIRLGKLLSLAQRAPIVIQDWLMAHLDVELDMAKRVMRLLLEDVDLDQQPASESTSEKNCH